MILVINYHWQLKPIAGLCHTRNSTYKTILIDHRSFPKSLLESLSDVDFSEVTIEVQIYTMKDFEKLREECIKEVTHLGIKLGNISSWNINTRAKSRWGLCRLNPDGSYAIEIAARLLEDDRISEKACKETIIHELLHTCKGCMRHTGKWKYYTEVVNQVYGYNIKRVTEGQEKGVENYEGQEMAVKYIFTCGKCGATIYRKRDSKFTRNYRYYGCARCGAAAWSRKTVG